LYSLEANKGDNTVKILIGYAMKKHWTIFETPQYLVGRVDDTLKDEEGELARSAPNPRLMATGQRLGRLSDGFVIVDAKTEKVEAYGPWLPTFFPANARLPSPGYEFYIHGLNLYLIETDADAQGRLVATSFVLLGSVLWLAALCGISFLSVSFTCAMALRTFRANQTT
jgi:hypothetical protein